jgi:hypothetical protein
MHEPFYVRPIDYRYTLASEPAYGWWTGRIRRGRQLLLGVNAVLLSDEARAQTRTMTCDVSLRRVQNSPHISLQSHTSSLQVACGSTYTLAGT